MYKSGDIIKVRITNITHFGFFFAADNNWKGLVHISEISDNYIYNIADYFEKGQEVEVLILDVDEKKKQINGSYKHINIDQIETKKFNSTKDFDKLKDSLKPAIDDAIKKINNEQ